MKLTLVSDFNVGTLGRFLNAQEKDLQPEIAPFNQARQTIENLIDGGDQDAASFIWAQPQTLFSGFAEALSLKPYNSEEILAEVDDFAGAVVRLAKRQKFCLVASWALPVGFRGYGILDWRPEIGLASLLARMNLRLAEIVSTAPNTFVLDSSRWTAVTANPAPPKLWFAAKLPYGAEVFKAASLDVLHAARAAAGRAKKIILLDLDNTLWGGIVGETGWQSLRLGGHDHVGEAFTAFQKTLKSLTRRGVQLAIVSKNDERVALEAIGKNPEMILRKEDFAGWRINWRDKAENIADLLDELRLGVDSAVFIDDNPAERDRVKTSFPTLAVPEWPADPALYERTLQEMGFFDSSAVSEEDRTRTSMYAAERERRAVKSAFATADQWLAGLKTRVQVEPVCQTSLPRVAQLFNKTNQLNLSTRRLSAPEIEAWGANADRKLLTFSVSDKFGDMGLCGVIGLEREGTTARLVDFILSCRAMGRRLEEAMIHAAVDWARASSSVKLIARYHPTPRNSPTLEKLRSLGAREAEDHLFVWDCGRPYPAPQAVELIRPQTMSE